MIEGKCNVEAFLMNHYDQDENFDNRIDVPVQGTRVNLPYVSHRTVNMMTNIGYTYSGNMITSYASISSPIP